VNEGKLGKLVGELGA